MRTTTPIVASLALALAAPAQSLVDNLVTNTGGQPSSGDTPFYVIGSRAMFVASGPFGLEPYVTDGTPAGTAILRDLVANGSSAPQKSIAYGSLALFTADVSGFGRELWRTDGTTAGTELVVDLYPGDNSSLIDEPVLFGGFVYFSGRDGTSGNELWRTDGTAAGTTLVADLRAGVGSSSPQRLCVSGGYLWFLANVPTFGQELHRIDTAGNVTLVADLTVGAGNTLSQGIWPFGSGVLMSLDAGSGYEPYFSDGTAAGTVPLADLSTANGGSMPRDFTTVGGVAVFSADGDGVGREVYVTDGTPAGTSLLRDIRLGSAASTPDGFTAVNGVVVFAAYEDAIGRELWVTDGTVTGTQLLADINPNAPSSTPLSLVPFAGEVWFSASSTGVGEELWRTDGTTTQLVEDLEPGNGGLNARGLTPFGAQLLFRGSAGNAGTFEPCITDGTIPGTVLLDDIYPANSDSSPDSFTAFGDRVLFAAGSDGLGREPYVTDGTPTGTAMLADLLAGSFGSNPKEPCARGDDVFFRGDLFGGGEQLFVAEFATQSIVQLTSATSPEPVPRAMAANGNKVIFSANSGNGREPWVSDGTVAGTFELLDIDGSTTSSLQVLQEHFVTANGLTFFAASDGVHGLELWATDGTTAGTYLVLDIRPGSSGSSIDDLAAFDGRVWFSATDGSHGTELWVSDGTAAGTQMVIDLRPGSISSTPNDLVASDEGIWFTAANPTREVYYTDGTAPGTVQLTTTGAGQALAYRNLTPAANGLFFLHDDTTGFGLELWFTGSAPATAQRLTDIAAGAADGAVENTLVAALGGSQLLFGANDLQNGLQLWLSDGTAANTQMVTSFGGDGYGAVHLENFFAIGSASYFSCDDGINGVEPWIFDPAAGTLAFVLPYGNACTGTPGGPTIGANGLPTIGNAAFAVTVADAVPLSAAVLVGAEGSNGINLGGGCKMLVDFPFVIFPAALLDGAGATQTPVPVPSSAAYIGQSLFFQWAVLDPAGPFLGDFDLSGGLQMRMGD
ncbi:MAG: hypothetical protein H6835_17000 [Planctomycetes bacterium]|nr:hypothetical protein [Planctomycetota bacterium]